MEDKNGKENNKKNDNEIKESNKESNNQTSDVKNATQETKKEANPKKEDSSNNNKDTFQDYVAEFKKIVWPSKPEIAKKTTTVISMSIFVGLIVFAMDSVLSSTYTASLRAIRDDIPDYSSDIMFDDAMIQEMLGDIVIEGEDGSLLDSSDYTINEDGSITIGGTTDSESENLNIEVESDDLTVDIESMMPEGAIPLDDGFIFDVNQYDFESDPLNLGQNFSIEDIQADLSEDVDAEENSDVDADEDSE